MLRYYCYKEYKGRYGIFKVGNYYDVRTPIENKATIQSLGLYCFYIREISGDNSGIQFMETLSPKIFHNHFMSIKDSRNNKLEEILNGKN